MGAVRAFIDVIAEVVTVAQDSNTNLKLLNYYRVVQNLNLTLSSARIRTLPKTKGYMDMGEGENILTTYI